MTPRVSPLSSSHYLNPLTRPFSSLSPHSLSSLSFQSNHNSLSSRMTSARSAACLFLIVAAALASAVVEGKNTPAAAEECATLMIELADCLSYVTNATVGKPEGNCCSGLKTVLKKQAECLCKVFKNSAQFGITVNATKAMSLPSACNVHAPSLAKCATSLAPAGAPAGSPAGAPTANPPSSSTGTIVPPASAPSGKGHSSTTRVSIGSVLALMAAAFFF